MNDRLVKSKLALKGMTIKDLAREIGEKYNSVYDVVRGKCKGKVGRRIHEKIVRYLGLDMGV